MIQDSHSSEYEQFYLLGYKHVVRRKPTDVSEEKAASIFRVQELAKKEIRMKLPAKCWFIAWFILRFFRIEE
jgi:hypothetical protein